MTNYKFGRDLVRCFWILIPVFLVFSIGLTEKVIAQTAAADSNSNSDLNSKMVQTSPARTEIEQRIADLMSQISVLQAQLNALRGQLGGGIAAPAIPTTDSNTIKWGADTGNTVANFSQNLLPGSRGNAVSNLQRALKADSSIYPEGLVTGYFGPLTENAIRRFQAKHNIVSSGDANTTGYGAVGPRTNAKLNNVFNYLMEQSQNPFLSPSPKPASCADETNDVAKDACWQSKAVADKDAALCNSIKISNPFVSKDGCLNLVAQAKKDKAACASITDSKIRKNCEGVASGLNVGSVTVLSPNGGEKWTKGSDQTIVWSASYSVSTVNIDLINWMPPCDAKTQLCPAMPSILYSIAKKASYSGLLVWNAGKDVNGNDIPVGQYIIRVSDAVTGIYDQSDAPFDILE